jgi:hypothetical protein
MFAKLKCSGCGAELSGLIQIRSTRDPARSPLTFEDQKPMTPPGEAIKSWEPMQKSHDPKNPAKLEFTPQFWLNPQDTAKSVEKVDDPRRLNGCCGLDGCDGPNMRCKTCYAVVGTRQSDCWTSDVFIPEPNATEWVKADQ